MGRARFAIFVAAFAAAMAWASDRAGATSLPVSSVIMSDARTAARAAVKSWSQRKFVRRHAARMRAHRANSRRAAYYRSCKRHHKCRRGRVRRAVPIETAVATPEPAAPAPKPALIERSLEPQLRSSGGDDIVEHGRDVAIILSIASTLRGFSVERAVSIIEVRDDTTGDITFRLVPGALDKCTTHSAELAELTLKPNERLIADLHSHPRVRAASRDLTEIAMARRATQANFYPGVDDYAAMVRRGVVSGIVDPDGGVMLLRRVAGAPSVRKIDGEALFALDESAAAGLELGYLYTQGYLRDGEWASPAVVATLHAGP